MYEKKIGIPEGVTAEISGNRVTISGEKGTLSREFKGVFEVNIKKPADGKSIMVSSESDDRKKKAIVGTIIAHVRNMIHGVTKGYTAKLRMVYSHFPFTLKIEGNRILIQNFIGEKTNRIAKIMGNNTKIEVKDADITVTGTDIEAVGQTAANMELVTKIKEHDQKVFQDGIYITEKPRGK
jgi:large subunit ribosomal protein L6